MTESEIQKIGEALRKNAEVHSLLEELLYPGEPTAVPYDDRDSTGAPN